MMHATRAGVGILFLSSVISTLPLAADTRPNIVIVLADDQGWGDLSVHGNRNLATPNIDSLARDGARFDSFFVSPVCAPTRAEFLTGRYFPRAGVHGVSTGAERLDLDERTIADVFKEAGYATGAFGKWHNGSQYPYHPNGRGFDEYYGFTSGHWGQYFDPVLEHNGELVRGTGFIIDDLTTRALQFVEASRDRPFFCYLPFNTPHTPFQVPDRFYEKFSNARIEMRHRDPDKEELARTRAALAMCENIDWNVGRILAKLDEWNLAEKTIVVYFSDNGPNSWRWNGGMKGRKSSIDEGGVRVPFFIRWPGRIPPGKKISRIGGAIDLLSTLSDLAGVPIGGQNPLDGISLAPLLFGSGVDWPDRMIFSAQRTRASLRTQRYRLDDSGQLFDMKLDPGQRTDISGAKPQLAARLTKALKTWKREVLSQSLPDDRPFPVGSLEFRTGWLPARDGETHGSIQRSARAPNCSFFTHWVSTEDEIAWDIEVLNAGQFEAVVYYTCAEKDVGSTVELSLGDQKIRAKVTEAHDPPLVGESFDRVPRGGESYVKDFRPLRLGVIAAQEGRYTVKLQAIDIAGAQVMDVRALSLILQ